MSTDTVARAIKAFEERAAARAVAAAELQKMAERSTMSLVKEELLRGVSRMLNKELEFLQHAEQLKNKRPAGIQS